MIRWTYILPRLMIVALIGLAIWIGSDLIIKRNIIQSLENAIGAKVDVAQIRTVLDKGKIFLKDARFADPRDPMVNLFQTELAYVELDVKELARKRVLIRRGKATNIQFGAPRTDSGFLRPVEQTKPSEPGKAQPLFAKSEIEKTWLDSLESTALQINQKDLVADKVANEILTSWEKELERVAIAINSLAQLRKDTNQHVAMGIQVSPNAPPKNPLRQDNRRIVYASAKVQDIQGKIRELVNTYESLQQRKSRDLTRLIQAVRMDEEHLAQLAVPMNFDGDKISKILLADLEQQYVEEIIEWYRWFRRSLPEPNKHFNALPQRGQVIHFGNDSAEPNFLVETLEFEGQGRLAGQHMDFSGAVHNLTMTPEILTTPTSFQLRAQGDTPVLVNCVLDRRDGQTRDQLQVTVAGLESQIGNLGTDGTLLVSVFGDRQLEATVDLYSDGDRIAGTIEFHHSNLRFHVENVHPLAGGDEVVLRMNQNSIPALNQFKTKVNLSGTIHQPTYQFESDLGERFAESLEAASQHKVVQQRALLQNRASRNHEALFQRVESKLTQQLQAIADGINGEKKDLILLQDKVAELQRIEDPFRR